MSTTQFNKSASTIIRFWRKYSSNRCVGCRTLLDCSNYICKSCEEEENEKVECMYCGSMEENATRSYPFCDNGKCEKRYCRSRERY
jgi:hypothetical protein